MEVGQIVLGKVKVLQDYGLYRDCEGSAVFVNIVDITWQGGSVDKD